MRATLLLCDGVQVIDGKLYVLGWGWSHTGPEPSPHALAVKLDVDYEELGVAHHWELFLEDENGDLVVLEGEDGKKQPLEVQNDFEIPRLPGLAEGTTFPVPLPLNFPPLPLPPGGRYTWRLVVDGQSDESWRVTFMTRAAHPDTAEQGS